MLESLSPLVQDMSFSTTSRSIKLSGSTTLLAECKKTDGTWVPSSLNLDTGIGNTEGSFDTSSKDYSLSANNVKLTGTTLSANLKTTGGSFMAASIDLDTVVANLEGVLTFQE